MAPDMAGHGMAWPLRLVDVLIRSKGFGGDTNLEPGNPSLSMELLAGKIPGVGGCFVMGLILLIQKLDYQKRWPNISLRICRCVGKLS